MSTSAAKQSANQANAQNSTGPRTEPGKAASSKNAMKSGLFASDDFVRPGEESSYSELDEYLQQDLVPQGQLEHHFVDEIRRAMWRLRRCGEVEFSMVETCANFGIAQNEPNGTESPIPDPMQNEPTAKLQLSVDRARAQCHRILNKCIAELRKLQTERLVRNETFVAGTDISHLGASDLRTINKAGREEVAGEIAQMKMNGMIDSSVRSRAYDQAVALPADAMDYLAGGLFSTKQTQPPADDPISVARNAQCPCGSGKKYKRCCGVDAPPVLNKAA